MPKKPKIEIATTIAVDALRPFVKEVLNSLAHHFESPGIARAFVSDESKVWDFMPEGYFSEDRKVDIVTDLELRLAAESDEKRAKILSYRLDRVRKFPDRVAALSRLASAASGLGVDVSVDDYIYEIAVRLRDKA